MLRPFTASYLVIPNERSEEEFLWRLSNCGPGRPNDLSMNSSLTLGMTGSY